MFQEPLGGGGGGGYLQDSLKKKKWPSRENKQILPYDLWFS